MKKITAYFLILILIISSVPGLDFGSLRAEAAGITMGESVRIPPGTTSITGGTRGYGIKPTQIGYRYMITDEEMKEDAKLSKDGHTENELRDKMRKQFNDHFPKHGASITVIPKDLYTQDMYATRYDPASGNLVIVNKNGSRYVSKMIKQAQGSKDSQLFQGIFDQIKSKGLKSVNSTVLRELRGKHSSGERAEAYFHYLTGDGNGIGARLDKALHPEGYVGKDKDIAYQAAYIAHLSYMRQAANPDMASYIDGVITRYTSETDDWAKKPGIIAVDSVVVIVTPSGNPNLAMASTDYINYHFGMKGGSRIDIPNWSNRSYTSTLSIMKDALAITHRNAPTRTATSNMSYDQYANTPFGWGFSALLDGYYFRSNKGQPNSVSIGKAPNAEASGYSLLRNLVFENEFVGFIIAVNDQLIPKGDPPPMRQDNYNDQPERTVIKVPADQTEVPIKLDVKVDVETKARNQSDVDKMIKYFKSLEGNYPLMITNMEIRTPFGNFTNAESNSGQFTHVNGGKAYNGVKVPKTADDIGRMLNGKDTITYSHKIDKVYNYTSKSNVILRFEYLSKVSYRVGSKPEEGIDAEDDDGYSYFEIELMRDGEVEEKEPVELQIELKDPHAFSEVKEGDKPKEELWEAMQGVPTTETLHFSLGGSEFLIKARLKYHPDLTHTRTITLTGSKPFHGNFPGVTWDLPEPIPPGEWTAGPHCSSYSDTQGVFVRVPQGGEECEKKTSGSYCIEWGPPGEDEDGNPTDPPCIKFRYTYELGGLDLTSSSPDNVYTDTYKYSYVEMLSADVYQLEGGHIKGLKPVSTGQDQSTVNLKSSQFSDKELGKIAFHKAKGNTGPDGRFYYNDYGPHTQDIEIPGSWDGRSIKASCGGTNNDDDLVCDYTGPRDASTYPSGDPYHDDIESWIKARDDEKYYDMTMVSDYLVIQTESGTVPIYFSEIARTAVGTDKKYDISKSIGEITEAESQGGSMMSDPGQHNVYSTVGSGSGSLGKDDIPLAGYNGLYASSAPGYGKYSPRIIGGYQPKDMDILTNSVLTFGSLMNNSEYHKDPKQVTDPVAIGRTGDPEYKIIHSPRIDMWLEHPNGLYTFTETQNHYTKTLDFEGEKIFMNNNSDAPRFDSTYSETHNAVNQIVIHDPVSVEYSEVISSPDMYFDITDSSMKSMEIAQSKAKDQSNFSGDGSTGHEEDVRLALDRPFTVNFPNIGDYHNNGTWGISDPLESKGPSYSNDFPYGGILTTTKWTKAKYISFSVPVIYKGEMYLAGDEIEIGVTEGCTNEIADECFLQFYLPLAAGEHQTATATFHAEAINMSERDAQDVINRDRANSNLQADHHAEKEFIYSVIGRAGNLIIEDSTDFRYSNTFKKPIPDRWLIKNLVRPVDETQQNTYFATEKNYNLEHITIDPNYIDTYQSLRDGNIHAYPRENESAYAGHREPLPLTPDKNNIDLYKKTPIRLGNKIHGSFQSIGDYHAGLAQMKLYYYAYDINTGQVTPVDLHAYNDTTKEYEKYYEHNGWDNANFNPLKLYDSTIFINWQMESPRRNYKGMEKEITENISRHLADVYDEDENGTLESNNLFGNDEYNIPFLIPNSWNYAYGTAQILQMMGRNKTFHGTNINENILDDDYNPVDGLTEDKNPGNKIPIEDYQKGAQRWHFSLHLPASTVPVRMGQKVTKQNVDKVSNGETVILVAADIKVLGEDYALKLHHGPDQFALDFGNGEKIITTDMLSNSTPGTYDDTNLTLLTVYSSNKSVDDDVDQSGTH